MKASTSVPKHVDALGRRKGSRPQPIGKAVDITPRIMALVDAIRRKGPLTRPLAFPLWQGEGSGGWHYFRERMTSYFHESGLLTLPDELNPDHVHGQQAWYDLSPAGLALAESNRSYVFPPKSDWLHHRAMGAAIAASFEILAPKFGLGFVDKEDIAKKHFPSATIAADNPLRLSLPHGKLEPDDLFGLSYQHPSGRTAYRYFAREDDRATESFTRSDKMQTSLQAKLDKYLTLFENPGLFQEPWGVSNLRLLFVTTGAGRIDKALRYLSGKENADRFLFKAVPYFGAHWHPPKEAMAELFEPWQSVAGPFDITAL